jgi:micrococcal nuclease
MYEYAATVVRIVDGDTLYLDIDLGFFIRMTIDVRLKGINTPELRGPTRKAGLTAKAYVVEALPVVSLVVVRTFKAEKYGRYLADVYYRPGATTRQEIMEKPRHLNQELLDQGLAKPFMVGE